MSDNKDRLIVLNNLKRQYLIAAFIAETPEEKITNDLKESIEASRKFCNELSQTPVFLDELMDHMDGLFSEDGTLNAKGKRFAIDMLKVITGGKYNQAGIGSGAVNFKRLFTGKTLAYLQKARATIDEAIANEHAEEGKE